MVAGPRLVLCGLGLCLMLLLAACGGSDPEATTLGAGRQQALEAGTYIVDLVAREKDGTGPAQLPKIEITVPESVAAIRAPLAAFAVAGPAQRVGLRAHQRTNERRQQSAQQIRARRGELIGQQLLDIDMVGISHRVVLPRLTCRSFEESRDDRPLPGYDTPANPMGLVHHPPGRNSGRLLPNFQLAESLLQPRRAVSASDKVSGVQSVTSESVAGVRPLPHT